MSDNLRRHPAEVASDRLASALDHWNDQFTPEEREAVAMVRARLEQIAEKERADAGMPVNWPPPEVVTDPELAERIVTAYQKGEGGAKALARRFGVGQRAVTRVLDEHSIPRRKRGGQQVDPDALERAVNAYLAGQTVSESARSAGISMPTLSRHLEERGIRERKRRSS